MAVIPQEYQEVEYVNAVECDVDLNYVPKTAPKIVFTIMLVNVTDRDVAGFPSNTSPAFILDPAPAQSRWYNRYGSTASENYGTGVAVPLQNVVQSWEFGKYVKLNGETVYTNTDVDWSTNEQSMHLFAARNKHTGLRLYNCSFYDGDQLIRKLIPCYRKNDSVVGLYDTVSESFFTSAAGTLNASSDVTRESLSMLWLRRKMMRLLVFIKKLIVTAANGIVSFVTNQAMPTTITCEFSPVQSGTGDPSPSNVRPISGWTGCNIHHGKNLLDISQKRHGYYLDNNGVEQANGAFGYTLAFTPVISGKTYTLSGNLGNSGSAYAGFYLYNADKTFVGRSTILSNLFPYTYTIPSNVSYVRVQYFNYISNAQLEEGSTATTFEEYTANTLPVNWGLPDAYQEVEYIESSGTQWLDTGIVPTENTKVQMKLMNLAVSGNVIFGYHTGEYSSWRVFNGASGQCYIDLPTGSGSSYRVIVNGGLPVNQTAEVEIGNHYHKNLVTWVVTGRDPDSFGSTPTESLTLNRYVSTKEEERLSSNRWYYVKIFDGDDLVFYGIPAYRKSDDEAGMYDLVTGTFCTNSGTGEFIVGSNVGTLPGTVYGGTLTINEDGTGTLVVERTKWIEDGSREPSDWKWGGDSGEGNLYNRALFPALPADIRNYYANNGSSVYRSNNRKYLTSTNSNDWKNAMCVAVYSATGSYSFAYSIPKGLESKAEVAAYFAQNPTEVEYPLRTPVTYNLTASQVNSLIGTNNIWHDMNGSITVEYYNKQ